MLNRIVKPFILPRRLATFSHLQIPINLTCSFLLHYDSFGLCLATLVPQLSLLFSTLPFSHVPARLAIGLSVRSTFFSSHNFFLIKYTRYSTSGSISARRTSRGSLPASAKSCSLFCNTFWLAYKLLSFRVPSLLALVVAAYSALVKDFIAFSGKYLSPVFALACQTWYATFALSKT